MLRGITPHSPKYVHGDSETGDATLHNSYCGCCIMEIIQGSVSISEVILMLMAFDIPSLYLSLLRRPSILRDRALKVHFK